LDIDELIGYVPIDRKRQKRYERQKQIEKLAQTQPAFNNCLLVRCSSISECWDLSKNEWKGKIRNEKMIFPKGCKYQYLVEKIRLRDRKGREREKIRWRKLTEHEITLILLGLQYCTINPSVKTKALSLFNELQNSKEAIFKIAEKYYT